MILRGWALTAGNKVDEGIAVMRQGLAGYQATGAGIMRPYYLALMAQALATTGALERSLRLLDEAEAAVLNSGERWYEAELYRHKGRVVLQDSARAPEDERRRLAEDYFERALAVAGQQGAKSLELEPPRNSAGFGQAETRPRRPSRGSQRSTAASKKGSSLRTCGTPTPFFRRDEQAGRFHPRVPRRATSADGAVDRRSLAPSGVSDGFHHGPYPRLQPRSPQSRMRLQQAAHLEDKFVRCLVLRRQLDQRRRTAQPARQIRRPGTARLFVGEIRLCDGPRRFEQLLDAGQKRRRETVQRVGTLEPALEKPPERDGFLSGHAHPLPEDSVESAIESPIGITPRGKLSSLSNRRRTLPGKL